MYTRTHLTRSNEPHMWCYQSHLMLVLGAHFVSRDFLYTIWIGRTWRVKWRLVEVDRIKYDQVMVIYPSGYEEMDSRRKKLHLYTLLSGLKMDGYTFKLYVTQRGILWWVIIYKKFPCRPNSFYTMAVYLEACIESQFSGVCIFGVCILL